MAGSSFDYEQDVASSETATVTPRDIASIGPDDPVVWQYIPDSDGSVAVDVSLVEDPGSGDWLAHAVHASTSVDEVVGDKEDRPFRHMRWVPSGAGGTLHLISGVQLDVSVA